MKIDVAISLTSEKSYLHQSDDGTCLITKTPSWQISDCMNLPPKQKQKIKVLDHLITRDNSYFSFQEADLLLGQDTEEMFKRDLKPPQG